MEHLLRIRDSVINYLSPPAKRRRTVNPTTPEAQEHAFSASFSDAQGKRAQAAAHIRPSEAYTPGFSSPRKRDREEDDDSITFSPPVTTNESVSQNSQDGEDSDSELSDVMDTSEEVSEEEEEEVQEEVEGDEVDLDEEDEVEGESGEEEEVEEEGYDDNEDIEMEDDDIDSPDKVAQYLAQQEADLLERRKGIEQFKLSGKHKDEIYLYERLSLRGYETLFPKSWQVDLRTITPGVFTENPDEVVFTSNHLSENAACKAFQHFIHWCGCSVRANVSCGSETERPIAREIRSYIRWAARDGGFFELKYIPVLTLVVASPGQTKDRLSSKLTSKMQNLARRHREHLNQPNDHIDQLGEVENYSRQPPLLYGILVAQTMAIIFTLDSSDKDATPRYLADAQFLNDKMDVWNSAAIALTIIMARNYMMTIKDEFELRDDLPDLHADD